MTRKIDKVIAETLNPIRRNTLKARRHNLGLSRNGLARILEVDPSSVSRHEQGAMTALWDYALRGALKPRRRAKMSGKSCEILKGT